MHHMKAFIFDDKKAYIGSVNFTQAALGRKNAHKRNFEAGILTDDPEVVNKVANYFDDIWTEDYCETCQVSQCKWKNR